MARTATPPRVVEDPFRVAEWKPRAACRHVDPEVFFPTSKTGLLHDQQVAAAKAVCADCPVKRSCADWAMENLSHGIAGGLTEEERRSRRPSRDRTAVGA